MVVYIIADNRSGSTLLDYLLSSHPDTISVGEIHHLHGFYYKNGTGKSVNWKCSCGKHVQSCVFWTKILNQISFNKSFITIMNYLETGFFKKLFRVLFLKRALRDKIIREKGKIMAQNRWEIYHAVAQQTKQNIIIDSSKNADEAYFLNKHKQGDIRFILLNRDINQIALSKKNRAKELKSFYDRKEQSLFRIILFSYNIYRQNRLILKTIQKSSKDNITKTIEYENLTLDPQKVINEICAFLNIPEFIVPKETNIYETAPHILGGSPSRYKRRPIQPDTRWKSYYKKRKMALALSRILQKI